MTDTKAEWRERLLRARRAVDAGTRREAGAAVVARLAKLRELARARSLLSYLACGAELDIGALAQEAACRGKSVYHPASMDPPPAWIAAEHTVAQTCSLPPNELTSEGARGGPQGVASAERLAFPTLLIAPGVGFDMHGGRLGRGAGYYDRAIAALREAGEVVVVGVAYDLQLVAALPQDPWDERVDLVVTERRLVIPNPVPRRDPSVPCAGGGTK